MKQTDDIEAMEDQNKATEDKRGPTIPRNTGQRYTSTLSPHGAEPKHHITFASHDWK